jgi:hypothetical protein
MARLRVDNTRTNEIAMQTRDIAKEVLENSHALDLVLQSMLTGAMWLALRNYHP